MLWFCFVVFVLCFSGLSIFDCPFCILFRFMSLVKTSIRYVYRNDAYLKTDGVCQQDSVFLPGIAISSNNTTDSHDIIVMLISNG